MSKFEECLTTYKTEMTNTLKIENYDETLLTNIAKYLGPSIYNNDSSKVSTSDTTEMTRVKENFLMKKLGITNETEMTEAITKATELMGSSNKNKYRAIYYYLLTKELNKENTFLN